MEKLIPHLVISLGIASFLAMWFKADLPVLLTKILRTCGWRKKRADFWPDDIEYEYWIRTQWAKWATVKFPNNPGKALVHVMNCPYCLSFHLGWLSGVISFLLGYPEGTLYCVAYPALALIFYKLT